ncbi:MAG: 23S rRNA (guanosine(2251)-2'-O)-methyltransferase RlmB [Chromatiales bacterium]|nr:23S rRNA (guanosine(2251)-2'-O)-methyltransferase RlmB [Chromatiales bacterium]
MHITALGNDYYPLRPGQAPAARRAHPPAATASATRCASRSRPVNLDEAKLDFELAARPSAPVREPRRAEQAEPDNAVPPRPAPRRHASRSQQQNDACAPTPWSAGTRCWRCSSRLAGAGVVDSPRPRAQGRARGKQLLDAARTAGDRGRGNDHRLRRSTDEAGHANHQGVLAQCRAAAERTEGELPGFLAGLPGPALLLVLDGIQDPHNLGACLRSADAAGVQAVILPKDNAAPMTAVVRKVASGAAEALAVFQVTNLARALDVLKEAGIWLVGRPERPSRPCTRSTCAARWRWCWGPRAGLRRLTRERCDHLAHIPMAGTVASLNVSVATGIFLFEAVRQRRRWLSFNPEPRLASAAEGL